MANGDVWLDDQVPNGECGLANTFNEVVHLKRGHYKAIELKDKPRSLTIYLPAHLRENMYRARQRPRQRPIAACTSVPVHCVGVELYIDFDFKSAERVLIDLVANLSRQTQED